MRKFEDVRRRELHLISSLTYRDPTNLETRLRAGYDGSHLDFFDTVRSTLGRKERRGGVQVKTRTGGMRLSGDLERGE